MNNKIYAVNIPTKIFYEIETLLKDLHFKLVAEYDPSLYDKAVDFDYLKFTKDDEVIELIWDNWFEGEIKADKQLLDGLSKILEFDFIYDKPHLFQDYKIEVFVHSIIHY